MGSRRRRPRLVLIALAAGAALALWWAGYQRTATVAEAASATRGGTGSEYAVRYRDGIYKGWGRRRHGGVEATVTIKRGAIATVSISLCDTRYPCTYIEPLPPQAVLRNSAEVDAISGATESSDAFARAVADALKKAERPRRQR